MKSGISNKANGSLIVKIIVIAEILAFIWIIYILITKS